MTRVIPPVCACGVVLLLGCAPAVNHLRILRAPTADRHDKIDLQHLSVRSENAAIMRLLADTMRQSPTLARLVREIGLTNGIVYIQAGRCPVPGLRGCMLHLLGHAHQARYLWIRVHPAADPLDLASTIAHELQHALEVLQNPSIQSASDLLQFYRSPQTKAFAAGGQGFFQSYETADAIAVGATVRMELTAYSAAAAADADMNAAEAPIPP